MSVDYGGTGASCSGRRRRARLTRSRPQASDCEGGIKGDPGLMEQLETQSGRREPGVGIGVPGSVDRATGRVSMRASPVWLHGPRTRGDLGGGAGVWSKIPTTWCFALSEAVDSGGAGAEVNVRDPRHRRRRQDRGPWPPGRGINAIGANGGISCPTRSTTSAPDRSAPAAGPYRGLAERLRSRGRPARHLGIRSSGPKSAEIVAAGGGDAAAGNPRRFEDCPARRSR